MLPWSDVVGQLRQKIADVAFEMVVLIPRLHQAECVMTADVRMEMAREAIAALAVQGWRVNALVPLHALGSAHEVFRGMPVHLQGWWERENKHVMFSSPEVA